MPKMPPTVPKMIGLNTRVSNLQTVLQTMLEHVPTDWGVPNGRKAAASGQTSLIIKPCEDYRTLVTSWRKAMKWTEGLDVALSVMLASIASTKCVGDQLWVKIIGPASCGKSTLCEAVSTNKEYVLAKSTMRGFHSGYGERGEDHSLVSTVDGKTLVTKDGDTLIQSPNLGQILSEARDVYDGDSRTSYRNAKSTDYEGIRMTWILCGTSSLRSIDSSELGERFLDCVIMEGIDDEMENDILWRVANRAAKNLTIQSDGQTGKHHEESLAEAMCLTGGYVEYLRENAKILLSEIEIPDWARHLCTRLGKFVAFMRARPSRYQDENYEREFGARLVSQHVRLMVCMAAVLNKRKIDATVMQRVTKVTMDTSRGQTLEIVKFIYSQAKKLPDKPGVTTNAVTVHTGLSDHMAKRYLSFLKGIGVVEIYEEKKVSGVKGRVLWVLTPIAAQLYSEVFNWTETIGDD